VLFSDFIRGLADEIDRMGFVITVRRKMGPRKNFLSTDPFQFFC
jgi:hypothetical protein